MRIKTNQKKKDDLPDTGQAQKKRVKLVGIDFKKHRALLKQLKEDGNFGFFVLQAVGAMGLVYSAVFGGQVSLDQFKPGDVNIGRGLTGALNLGRNATSAKAKGWLQSKWSEAAAMAVLTVAAAATNLPQYLSANDNAERSAALLAISIYVFKAGASMLSHMRVEKQKKTLQQNGLHVPGGMKKVKFASGVSKVIGLDVVRGKRMRAMGRAVDRTTSAAVSGVLMLGSLIPVALFTRGGLQTMSGISEGDYGSAFAGVMFMLGALCLARGDHQMRQKLKNDFKGNARRPEEPPQKIKALKAQTS